MLLAYGDTTTYDTSSHSNLALAVRSLISRGCVQLVNCQYRQVSGTTVDTSFENSDLV